MAQTVTCFLAPAKKLEKIIFTPDRIYQTLRNLKASFSSTPDGITNSFLRNCAAGLSLPLCHIFNFSFNVHEIRLDWSSACITPIHKKIKKTQYHSCCRAMEQVINIDILNHLQSDNLISPDQHGFLNMRSTCTNVIECTNDWSTAMQLHQGTDIIYFDFKKAFDSVSHQKLMNLQTFGISDNLFLWIRKFLSNRTQAVKMNGNYPTMEM